MKPYRVLLLIAVSAVELSWLYPWLALLGRAATGYDVLKPAVGVGLFFLAMTVAELFSHWRIVDRYQQMTIGVLILLSALLLIRGQVYPGASAGSLGWLGRSLGNLFRFEPLMSRDLYLLLATFVLWWRGVRTGARSLMVDEVGFQFRLGVLLVVGLFVAQAFSGRQDAVGWLLLLFMSGLVAVALARIKDGLPAGQEARPLGPSWLLFLLVGAGGTLSLGLLLSLLLTTETALSRWLQPVVNALKLALLYVVFALSYLFVMALNALFQAIVRFLPMSEGFELETLTLSPPAPFGDLAPAEGLAEPPAWLDLVGKGLLALVIVAVFLVLLLTIRRWRLGLEPTTDVWRESVWSSREVGAGLLRGLRRNLRRLTHLFSGRERRRAFSIATIRRIYASLMELADRRGASRLPAQTPFEYLSTLGQVFPGWDAELRLLTRAYVDAHYGLAPDTEAELQTWRDVWQRIRAWAEAHPVENQADG